jgi:hypothetical protein
VPQIYLCPYKSNGPGSSTQSTIRATTTTYKH